MKIKKIVSYLFGFLVAFLFVIGFSKAEVIGISESEWNNKPDSYWFGQSCDEVIWNEIYSGEYQIYLDNFENPSSNHGALYIWNYKVLTRGNYILYNNSYGGSAGNGLVIFNRDYLQSINWKVNPGQTVRHLTTAQEVNGATFQHNWSLDIPYIANGGAPYNVSFNVPNYRSDGSHPSTPTAIGGNGYGDAEIRTITLYDNDNNINSSSNNRAIVECWKNVVRWCGDGIVDPSHGESCDEGSLNGTVNHCNLACTGILPPPPPENPQCSSIYSGTQYTNQYPWLTENTSGLCVIGTIVPGSLNITWEGTGHSRHYTWQCRVGQTNTTGCLAKQRFCGDGIISNGENCDEALLNGQPGHCNLACTGILPPPPLENPQCSSIYSGTQYTNQYPWLTENTSGLCVIGTIVPGSLNITWEGTGHSRHYTWQCRVGQTNTTGCLAKQRFCGDGIISNGEYCDEALLNGQPGHCNSACTGQVPVPVQPDLTIVKEQISTGSMEAGALVAYKITVRNIGSGAATGVTIYDVLPYQLQYMASSISIIPNSSYNFATGTVNIGGHSRAYILYTGITLNANGTATVYLTGKVKNGYTFNTLTNCASVSGTNIPQEEDCVTVTPPTPPTPPVQPDLTIVKEQISTGSMEAGALVAYKITVRNIGSGAATGVTIYDVLPYQLQYMASSISIVPNSSYNFATGTVNIGGHSRAYILYTGITLNANGTATVYLTGKVKNGYTFNTLTNCASVSGTNIPQEEDCVTVTPPTPPAAPHLTIDKELLTAGDMTAGSTIAYKITLTNDGNATYYNAYILDILPNTIQYQTSSIQNVVNYLFEQGNTGNNEYYIKYYDFNLAANHSAVVYLTGVLKQGFNPNETINCAFTSGAYDCEEFPLTPVPYIQKYQKIGNDNNPNSAGWTTHILNVEPGQYISYRIDFGNSGNKTATGEVRDILPQCVEYISGWLINANGVGPTYIAGQHIVQFTNIRLVPGQRAHMMVLGKIKQGAGCQNVTGYLNTGSFHFINKPWQNSTVIAVRPNDTTNVVITKEVSPTGPVQSGDIVIYTIDYENKGPEVLQSYTIVDYWPSDKLNFMGVVSMNPTASSNYQGTRVGNNIVKWTFNTPLPVNGTGQIVIKGQVKQ